MITDEQKQFKDKLLFHAKMCINTKKSCTTEEAAKQGLILPFLQLLGYNVFNINEVTPEHSADFSDKYKNRVDYVIKKDLSPVIAIEAKLDIEKSDRGQLKSYFNACPSIKLGILSDGLVYELFADNKSPNIMDDNPFLTFDFNEIANGNITIEQLKDIMSFMKSEFNPDNVGTEAQRKVMFSSMIKFLEDNLKNPSTDFIKYLLSKTDEFSGNNRITSKIIELHTELIKSTLKGFIDKGISDRLGLSNKEDKKEDKKEDVVESNIVISSLKDENIVTDGELKVFEYIKHRLAFLVDTDELFENIKYIEYKNLKTIFIIYYKQQRTGKMFDFRENSDGTNTLTFSLIEKEITCKVSEYHSFDNLLLESYKKVCK